MIDTKQIRFWCDEIDELQKQILEPRSILKDVTKLQNYIKRLQFQIFDLQLSKDEIKKAWNVYIEITDKELKELVRIKEKAEIDEKLAEEIIAKLTADNFKLKIKNGDV